MKQTISVITCLGLFAGLAGGQAAEETAKAAPTLTAADRKIAEGNYLVPSPADVLGALQHTAKIDWKALSAQVGSASAGTTNAYAEDSQKALNLGMRVADAFVAVEAHDKEQFERSSGAVEKFGTELSPSTNLSAKRAEAKKFVDEGDWPKLSNLLEQIRFEFLRDFKAIPDEDSVILANLGGWLRGLDLVSGALSKDYTADATKVLRQSGLIAYLNARVDKLEAPASTSKEVALIKSKLGEIEALCNFAQDATLPQDKVQRLHEITSELVKAVQK